MLGDEEYPPLPKSLGPQSGIHSRVSSFQSSLGGYAGTPKIPPGFEKLRSTGERSITPQIPPGFEDLHAHPSRTDNVTDQGSSRKGSTTTGVIPLIPAVPAPPRSRKASIIANKKTENIDLSDLPEQEQSEEDLQPNEPDDATVVPDESTDREQARDSDETKRSGETHTTDTKAEDESAASVTAQQSDLDTSVIKEGKVPLARNEQTKEEKAPDHFTTEPGKISSQMIASTSQETSMDVLSEDGVIGTPDTMSRTTTPPPKKREEVKRPTLRTLNITSEMIARSESQSQAPPSTTTEKSGAFPTLSQARQGSRQPSVSVSTNVSRPSTPSVSDRLMSQDVSRASSPPPSGSLLSSANSRPKTKNQLKKERREKTKKPPEASDAGSVTTTTAIPTPPPNEEVGPIVARQKKQRKQKSTGKVEAPVKASTDDKPKLRSDKDVAKPAEVEVSSKEITVDEQAPSPKVEQSTTPPAASPIPSPPTKTVPHVELDTRAYTLRDYYNDAHKVEARYDSTDTVRAEEEKHKEIQDLLISHVSPLQKLLSDLIASGDLSKDHPLFLSPPFTSAAYKLLPDNRKGQEYLDGNGYTSSDVFGMIYLPNKEKRALYNGHAVSVADSGDRRDDLLRRCLITPNGAVLRHLSREEGEKVLDLEERRLLYAEEYGDLGRMDGLGRLEDYDFINLEGGFDELSRFGERHGICWVVADNERSEGGKRTRYVRMSSGNGLEDDYGVTDVPVDADDYDDQDQFDDPDDEEDEEEELEGEEMVLEAEAHIDEDAYAADESLAFESVRGGVMSSGMNLPPLPDMINMNMPGAWDPHFNSAYPARITPRQQQQHSMYGSLAPTAYDTTADLDLPPPPPLPLLPPATAQPRNPNTLPPMRHPHTQVSRESTVNLRAMSMEQLEKRVKEKQREIELSRKEADKAEKLLNKKVKDAGRWREGVFKAVPQGVVG